MDVKLTHEEAEFLIDMLLDRAIELRGKIRRGESVAHAQEQYRVVRILLATLEPDAVNTPTPPRVPFTVTKPKVKAQDAPKRGRPFGSKNQPKINAQQLAEQVGNSLSALVTRGSQKNVSGEWPG